MGLPFYLELAVETYEEICLREKRAPHVDDFAITPREVLDRFLWHLRREEVETLKILCFARMWDLSLVSNLVKYFATGYPQTALVELCRFSFVEDTGIEGEWTIHPLMRSGLQEHVASNELKRSAHEFLFIYYSSLLKVDETKDLSVKHTKALEEAFYHARHHLALDEVLNWFYSVEGPFVRAARWNLLANLQSQICDILKQEKGFENETTAHNLRVLADRFDDLGRYSEAESLYRSALIVEQQTLGRSHPRVAATLNNLAGLLLKNGRLDEAQSFYKEALSIKRKNLGEEHTSVGTSLNNIGELYLRTGDLKNAFLSFSQALCIKRVALGTKHPEVGIVLNNLGELYLRRKCPVRSEILFKAALKTKKAALGERHPSVAITLQNMGNLYDQIGRHAEALSFYNEAKELLSEGLGPLHPEIEAIDNKIKEIENR